MFMEAGVSAYKCTSCIRRSPQTTDIEEVNVMTNVEAETANTSTVSGELLPSEAVLMFTNILNKLDLLVTEVKCLRADFESLRSELSQIRKCLPSMKKTPTVPPTNHAAVASSHSSAFPPVMSAPGTLGHPSSSAPSASNFSERHGALSQQASVPYEGTVGDKGPRTCELRLKRIALPSAVELLEHRTGPGQPKSPSPARPAGRARAG
ncbi:hypothetical protein HPB47_017037 [Ixodes persulcatus]|uniref:Uncharacterized protein n=1 Tax=Ixodes persulcatus TaxID=34615 RepID=A0AC60QT25_IXOPE|nr:hypothetical protein HPB47_017037 [Ixodes persulcatus]